ncbi:MAG: metal-dependent transcriptional regulator [Bacteroidota bacterium]
MTDRSTEDYVKNIYKLARSGGRVTTSALARSLRVADPSATDMIKRLSERGLLRHVPYRGVALTTAGNRMALRTLRRHRLWEAFLVKHLGYSWDRIHDEAERLEHATSEFLELRLDKALGRPETDPHGDPIPTSGGRCPRGGGVRLVECHPGERVRVVRVEDEDPRVLQRASRLGLAPKTRLRVMEAGGPSGPMAVRIGGREYPVGRRTARAIFVERI